ncbi:hypothetical protein M942_24735 [Enterobacter ludwigii]|jgi:hypothetical protein|uniref:hypothetical protein n=1 Tax=Enterobacter ludwigii TaxID=299767 RepID=UPI0003D7F8A7|nr:hypothetical protein [Enterobacter ludwigii]AHE73597.1 hypothetical protein M942_24735 [Enterobacter ludwigii]KLP39421.1 hypothetical protein ABR36_11020 [Enterobacter ludwigii]
MESITEGGAAPLSDHQCCAVSGKPAKEPDSTMFITGVFRGKKELVAALTRMTITMKNRDPESATIEGGGAVLD